MWEEHLIRRGGGGLVVITVVDRMVTPRSTMGCSVMRPEIFVSNWEKIEPKPNYY